MGRGKSLKRPPAHRRERRRVLIYCEGECTEDQYFKGLRADLRHIPLTIALGPAHGVPTELVRAAVKHKERAPTSPADRRTAYDEVWCVMDVEAPAPHPDLQQALRLAGDRGIKVALSNPCFELWLLLQFQDVTRYRTSAQAQQMLGEHKGCGYRRDRKHLDYPALRSLHTDACDRAAALRAVTERGHRTNPWTDVDQLVQGLMAERRPGG
ncbi:RloB family protein [Streptomyces cheonanensis]|uniref:RloB family protein n=1 Tax=Streptomyces cheonanensis TaxID=312720 RepID=A0ABN2V4D2_9ACTN